MSTRRARQAAFTYANSSTRPSHRRTFTTLDAYDASNMFASSIRPDILHAAAQITALSCAPPTTDVTVAYMVHVDIPQPPNQQQDVTPVSTAANDDTRAGEGSDLD